MKKFGIIGPGAVGSAIAYALIKSGEHVTLFGKDNSTVTFQDYNEKKHHEIPVHALKNAHSNVDILFIAVKTTQLDAIMPYVSNIIHKDSVIILTQNGYGQLEKIKHPYKYQAVVYISGQKDGSLVTHYRDWTLKLPINEHTLSLQQMTQDSLLNIECLDDYAQQVWYKLIVNLGINTVTALTRQPAKILHSEKVKSLCFNLLIEGKMIAQAEGISFDNNLEESIMRIYEGYPDEMGTSMYYDMINHRPLETQYIQGYMYHLSIKHQLNTPYLDSTYALLNAYD